MHRKLRISLFLWLLLWMDAVIVNSSNATEDTAVLVTYDIVSVVPVNSDEIYTDQAKTSKEDDDDFVTEMNSGQNTEPITISPTKVVSLVESSESSSRPSSDKELEITSPEPTTASDEFTVALDEQQNERITEPPSNLGSTEDFISYKLKDLSMDGIFAEGTDLYSSLVGRQEKSSSNNNTPLLSSTDKHSVTNLFSFDEFPVSENPNFGLKSEVSIEATSTVLNHQTLYQDSIYPVDSDIVLDKNESSVCEKVQYEAYRIIIQRNCSKNSTFYRMLELFPSYNQINSEDETKSFCESSDKLDFALNSQESFVEFMKFLKKEAITNDLVVINVHSNSSTFFDLLPQVHQSQDGFYVSYTILYIVAASLLALVALAISITLCTKIKCRKSATSLDLSDIPHLNLKPEYNLSPIPRPSISFPESNRNFLHAYANESYNRSRADDTILNQHHFSNAPDAYDIPGKGTLDTEMRNFASRRLDFMRNSLSNEYATPDSRRERRKYGLDNPGYKKW